VRETALQTPRSAKKEERRCSRHWSRDSPADPGADQGEAGLVFFSKCHFFSVL